MLLELAQPGELCSQSGFLLRRPFSFEAGEKPAAEGYVAHRRRIGAFARSGPGFLQKDVGTADRIGGDPSGLSVILQGFPEQPTLLQDIPQRLHHFAEAMRRGIRRLPSR